MGQDHEIPLSDLLYIDVGKTTPALRQLDEDDIADDLCFSILTRVGTLDLNAGNKMERDAIISSFCLILDTVQMSNKDAGIGAEHSWRDLYQQMSSIGSPNRSTVSTSVTPQPSSIASNKSSDVFSNISGTTELRNRDGVAYSVLREYAGNEHLGGHQEL